MSTALHTHADTTRNVVAALMRGGRRTPAVAASQRLVAACRATASTLGGIAELQPWLQHRRHLYTVERSIPGMTLPELLASMCVNHECARLQRAGLCALMQAHSDLRSDAVAPAIALVMRAHPADPVVLNLACYALEAYCRGDPARMMHVANAGALARAVAAEYAHGVAEDTHFKGFRALLVPIQLHHAHRDLPRDFFA